MIQLGHKFVPTCVKHPRETDRYVPIRSDHFLFWTEDKNSLYSCICSKIHLLKSLPKDTSGIKKLTSATFTEATLPEKTAAYSRRHVSNEQAYFTNDLFFKHSNNRSTTSSSNHHYCTRRCRSIPQS